MYLDFAPIYTIFSSVFWKRILKTLPTAHKPMKNWIKHVLFKESQ